MRTAEAPAEELAEEQPDEQREEPPVEEPPTEKRVLLTHTIEARKARLPRRGEREVRTLPMEKLTLSESQSRAFDPTDNDGRSLLRFSGYASLFEKRYSVGKYEEEIARGAFQRSLANPSLDCVLRVEHEDLPLARTTGSVTLSDGTTAPTLMLREDEQGLHVEALLDPEDPDVARLVPKFRRGDLGEMSFGFRCDSDVWNDDFTFRTIKAANIHRGDVAIVTFGASPTTTSELRSEEALNDLRERGFAAFMDAMVEWRDWTWRTPPEERAGKMLSTASHGFLSEMLGLFANADEAVDEGQARLADFLGVSNPNDDAAGIDSSDGSDDDAESDAAVTSSERAEDYVQVSPRDYEFLYELRKLEARR